MHLQKGLKCECEGNIMVFFILDGSMKVFQQKTNVYAHEYVCALWGRVSRIRSIVFHSYTIWYYTI